MKVDLTEEEARALIEYAKSWVVANESNNIDEPDEFYENQIKLWTLIRNKLEEALKSNLTQT